MLLEVLVEDGTVVLVEADRADIPDRLTLASLERGRQQRRRRGRCRSR